MAITRTLVTPSGTVVEEITGAELTEFEATREANVASAQAIENAIAQKATDKANAKAKLIAGEPLTEDEANTIVL